MSHPELRRYAEMFCNRHDSDWVLTKEIGSGNSATVYQVRSKERHAALKIYHPRFFVNDRGEVEKRRLLDQMSLKGHGHPNLIDFLDAGPVGDTYFLLMEFLPWSSLDRRLGMIDREHIAQVISKVAAAAEFLEQQNKVHRDIKPANVLVSGDCQGVKLLDLGVMRTISADGDGPETDHGYALPFVATAQYSSPAYLFREDSSTEDLWRALTFYQLGAVLHDLLMKRPLFDDEARTLNKYRIAAAVLLKVPEIYAADAPARLVALARNGLVKDDNLRLSRVGWSSFHAHRRRSVTELRARLGLEPSAAPADAGSSVRARERLRVRLDERSDFLINLSRHVLRREGFPQAGMTQELHRGGRDIRFSFVPGVATEDSAVEVQFVLRLVVRDDAQELVDLFLASLLTRAGASSVDCRGTLIWTTTLETLRTESEQLDSLLTEEFIRRYAAAADRLLAFDDRNETTVEIALNGE